jgi:hypothetical protein
MSSSILKQFKCDLGLNHKIPKEAEIELYTKSDKVHTQCLRCNAKVILEIDPIDPDFYIATEQ